jgi:hypothetical protein
MVARHRDELGVLTLEQVTGHWRRPPPLALSQAAPS